MVSPPSAVLPSDGSEGRVAEVGSAVEVTPTSSILTETIGPAKEVPEGAVPVAKSPIVEIPATKNDQGGNAPCDDAPRAREDVPEIPVVTPAAEPSSGSASAKVPGNSGTKSSDTISNARAKILLGKWLALPLEEKVADEQGVKVSYALDSICRACPDFATFCETAKADLGALIGKFNRDDPLVQTLDVLPGLEARLARAKSAMEAQHQGLNEHDALLKQVCWRLKTSEARLARVLVQKKELQEAADQMLTTLSLAKEDLDKADMDVGLELWNERLKKVRVDRLRVDVLHFSIKIKTLLDLLV
ncbi:hypothetical protein Pyn_32782 [Prunus yedoensis var. nudiflora]|uniref:Uncharacterized protein n=1 Tax=Prunus yedoensis var. nudiflora TaxID=2094558 RepID=A0A314XIZ5_PRUYE|nr:hypothetical protein Pyn_32782 [Prunus yedoensis var. nudiflora]